ncbi:MAG: hypothetical protein C6H99_05745 [Epsilonproteobacteria bacterium]|nr:hypothetical protein [Campylobacterota bacterium]NPA64280.1 zinc-dependent peptidase [Campylobacterota bacterium]
MSYYLLLLYLFGLMLFGYVAYHIYITLVTDGRYRFYKLFRPFPKRYAKILERSFPFYESLPQNLKRNLEACIMTFIKEKEFIGRGVTIDDEKKVLVAANACLLTVGRDRCEYKHVKTIILYPEAVLKREKIQEGWVVREEEKVLLGEAWQGGAVVLSWSDLQTGDLNPNDGHNVGLHEFAHQIDMEDGYADGVPPLPLRLYPKWSKIMSEAYKDLKELYEKHKRGFLSAYALTNEAEFFAVATEVFFEQPHRLKKYEPRLYELLKEFYKVDPIQWKKHT